jgi:predicted secreted protein
MVKAWLAKNARPMGSRLGNQVESVETFTDEQGQPVYYVVYLRPNGFVIVPDEDLIEPVVCFSSGGSYDSSDRNPLGALVSRDLPGRVNAARAIQKKTVAGQAEGGLAGQKVAVPDSTEKALGRWRKLLADEGNSPGLKTGSGSISDVRVAPLLQTRWGQDTTVCGNVCFNYYTPPYGPGDANNYYSGCIATAMAQYMRFWQYPTAGVGAGCFTISVDGHPKTRCLRGGNGVGGAYNWSEMVLVPDCSTTLTQRQAIGDLAYDAGVAVGMDYESDGSSAYTSDAAAALVGTFGYSNAIYGYNNSSDLGAALNGMVNPNLDYGNPVILGISGPGSGHEVVADGYGYQSSVLYHHLNMGWDGDYDAWYNLPNIDDSYSSYNVVDETIYNIYISGTGEIISGRVTAAGSGAPISGATVTALKTGGGTYQATTNSNGIYAIANVPSNSTYTVSVTKSDYSFTSQAASTGLSQDSHAVSGNCWAVDFTGITTEPIPVASDSTATVGSGASGIIAMQASDDGQPNPPGALTYIITSLPSHGTLADPGAGQIDSVPYSLVNFGNDVVYTSVTGYTGPDSFHFKVNDGGSPPTGGNSNVATVSITVQGPSPQVIYETHFDTGLPAGWTIVDGGSSSDTWRSDNPGGWSSPYWTGVFMIVDSDYAGPVDMDEQLITQSIDCTDLSGVKLRFEHDFYHDYKEIGDVDVRINGGVWRNIARYQKADYAGLVELALSGFGADGDPNVQIRWHYYNANYDWYWGIDDVQIIATHIVPTVAVKKCSVAAGSNYNSGAISFSGTMNAITGHMSAASAVEVTVDSNDMISPCVLTFPINDKTFKKGNYSYSGTENGVRKSFTYNLKTGKFTFAASNVNLLGLGCPMTVAIKVGDYVGVADVNEAIINKPIPINLMMEVKDVLRVDKIKVNKPKSNQLSVTGGFAVDDPAVSMANRISEGLVVTLGAQQFTIPANELSVGANKFTCRNAHVAEGGFATADFNFKTCVFTLTIKNTQIVADPSTADFGVEFFGFSE